MKLPWIPLGVQMGEPDEEAEIRWSFFSEHASGSRKTCLSSRESSYPLLLFERNFLIHGAMHEWPTEARHVHHVSDLSL